MPQEHYFSAQPSTDGATRSIQVEICGKLTNFTTAAGVFSPGHLDTGTAELLRRVPDPPQRGNLLDLGCGWGPIALTLAQLSPAAQVWAVDINQRALELTQQNAAQLGYANVSVATPGQVPPDIRFDTIWSNPPIRIGKPALHALLIEWLGRLTPEGEAWLVVQRNLGADSLRSWLNLECPVPMHAEKNSSSKGFQVIRVTPQQGDSSTGN